MCHLQLILFYYHMELLDLFSDAAYARVCFFLSGTSDAGS